MPLTPVEAVQELEDAWNQRDWDRFARLFAPGAEYVTGAGMRLSGRERIREELASRPEGAAGDGLVAIGIEAMTAPAAEVAVVLCSWSMGERSGRITLVLERHAEEGWRILHLHNTDRSP